MRFARLSLIAPLLASALLLGPAAVAPTAAAQPSTPATIEGRITDQETGDPLPGVNVYVAQTMTGTTTDTEGRYRLRRVRPGSVQLVASIVGYERSVRRLTISSGASLRQNFQLKATVFEQEEVVVEAERDEEWEDMYNRFRVEFLGRGAIAIATSIQNPDVLRFEKDSGTLKARAIRPLIVVNRKLGYRIRFDLEDFAFSRSGEGQFVGVSFYERLPASNAEEVETRKRLREEVYKDSFRYFVETALAGQCDREGFEVIRYPSTIATPNSGARLSCSELLSAVPGTSLYRLSFDGVLKVTRENSSMESYVKLESNNAQIDASGRLVNPYAVRFGGTWGASRLPTMLPIGANLDAPVH